MFNERTLRAIGGALFMRRNGLAETEPVYQDVTDALALINAMLSGNTIASLWSIEDVYSLDDDGHDENGNYTGDITPEQARNVLRLAEREHDASIGINWDTLGYWLQEVRQGRA